MKTAPLPILLLALFMIFPGCQKKGTDPEDSTPLVCGNIWNRDTRQPLQSVRVTVSHLQLTDEIFLDSTNAGGYYSFSEVKAGDLKIGVFLKGYLPVEAIVVYQGGRYQRNFELTPDTSAD
jgi:hypothetical protein